jgi:hypothetical protein
MPNTSPAEWLLALFAGSERAAAIMGDLDELAATRGRVWFAAAYARTLLTFTWRIVLALAVAMAGRQIFVNSFHDYMAHTPAAWRDTTGSWLDLLNYSGPLLAFITSTLWFLLPFAAVRYGRRDRFVRLTFAVAVGTTLAFLCIPGASLLCAVATFALAVVAFASPIWRKPLAVLLCTGAAGLLALVAVNTIDSALLSHYPTLWTSHFFRHYGAMLIFRSSLLIVAIVCARLHGWLLQRQSKDSMLAH